MKIAQNITETIGHTPLVKLNRMSPKGIDIVLKLESKNPAGSVKDRVALSIVQAARESGKLPEGGIIVEATSGNTGIGLAMVGAALGYRVVITMPASMSMERRALMKIYGAQLILTPPEEGMAGAVKAAEDIVAKNPEAILASQFANAANPAAHYRTTAMEIWEDTAGNVDMLVAGVGTGGTVTGVGKRLKELTDLKVIAVEPAESPLLSEGKAGPHKIQGIGANFVPEVLDQSVIDQVWKVAGEKAIETAQELARKEGILVGISAGAAVRAALEVAESGRYDANTIVVVAPDTGERYLSTDLFSEAR